MNSGKPLLPAEDDMFMIPTLTTKLPATVPFDNWTINLRGKKVKKFRRIIMNLFKRKKKRLDCYGNRLTEQQYVEYQFNYLSKRIDYLTEKIEILNTLNQVDHVFVDPNGGFYNEVENKNMWSKEARTWLKKNGYSYEKAFKDAGELWIREEKAKK